MNGKVNYCLEDIAIKLATNNQRMILLSLLVANLMAMSSKHVSHVSNLLFQHRAICEWNVFHERISKSSSLGQFQKLLRAHLQNFNIA